MKYEITVENDRIVEMRPVEGNKFRGLCIGANEANGMSKAMDILVQFLEKEEPSEINKRMIHIAEDYSESLKYLAKQLGYEGDQDEDENEC